jgi:ATP-dependent Lon protease
LTTTKEKFKSQKLPMMPIRDVVIFPHMMMPFVVGRESSIHALDKALAGDKKIFLATQHDASVDEPKANEIYQVGTVANIVESLKFPDGNIKVQAEGVERGKILQATDTEGYFQANIRTVKYTTEVTPAIESAMQRITSLFEQYVKLCQSLNYETMIAAVRMEDPAKLTDTIAANLQLSIEEKQELLEIFDPAERLNRIADVLDIEIEKLNMDRTIQSRVKRQMERAQKEYYLKEKIKAIQKELGRGDISLSTGQTVGLKLADGNVIQGKIADATWYNGDGVWLDVDKSLWVALAGTKRQVQYPFEKDTGTLRCFVPFSSITWLMTTTASPRPKRIPDSKEIRAVLRRLGAERS